MTLQKIETDFYDATSHLTPEARRGLIDEVIDSHLRKDNGKERDRLLREHLSQQGFDDAGIEHMIETGSVPILNEISALLIYVDRLGLMKELLSRARS